MSKKNNVAGGSATGGGINFQAAVSAIVAIYVLRGQPLQWLSGVVDDVPVSLEAETGGAGDDISLVLSSGNTVEVQVKKGLQSGSKLWDSLIAISKAINDGTTDYGVLIVSPSSSNTIKENLSKDIIRLGDGRTDGLSDISEVFKSKLEGENLPVIECCKRIRIQVIYANGASQADIKAAQSELAHLCRDKTEILAAWGCLERDAADLIEKRGRRDVSSTLRLLDSKGVQLTHRNNSSPLIILKKLTKWVYETSSDFSIFGIAKSLRVDEAWIPLRAIVKNDSSVEVQTLGDALKKYQSWEFQTIDPDAKLVNPETLCRFVRRAILVGGPGMGKTTLLKRIARRYSEDAIPVLQLKLKLVAARMQSGSSFEESVFSLSLDGCGVDLLEIKKANFPNWVLLCDGLDECGSLQEHVATGVTRFAIGHPDCRVLVTTRPVGYEASHFSDWRHYDLAPLDPSDAISNIKMLLVESLPEHSESLEETQNLLSIGDEAKAAIARSPLLLGLSASIIARGGKLEGTKEKLFEQIFELIDEVPNSRAFQVPSSRVLLGRYLDSVGWYLTLNPLCKVTELLKLTAQGLMKDMGSNSFKAATDAEAFLEYWQDVGVIERIRHGAEETLTFIHKSFGAYVAARYLLAMSLPEQEINLCKIVDDSEWQEVIGFVSQLGLADILCKVLSAEDRKRSKTSKIIQAVGLVAIATPPIKTDFCNLVISDALNIVQTETEYSAFQIGIQIVKVARRFPKLVVPLFQKLLNDERSWIRVIAWAVVVCGESGSYAENELRAALSEVIETPNYGLGRSLGGGLFVNQSSDKKLRAAFAVDVLKVLIEQTSSEINSSTIIKIHEWLEVGPRSALTQVESLIMSSDKYPEIVKAIVDKSKSRFPQTIMVDLAEYEEICFRGYIALFDALEIPEALESDDFIEGCLLNLSAFLVAINFHNGYDVDQGLLTDNHYKDSNKLVLNALIELTGINYEALKKEGQLARRYLRPVSATMNRTFFSLLSEVDTPEVDWSGARALNLDPSKVEHALFSSSDWMIWVAASLLENILSKAELELVIRRILDKGEGYVLHTASEWLQEGDNAVAESLLLERLTKPLVSGCDYLFKALQKIGVQEELNLVTVVKNGLYADAATARQAAQLIIDVAKSGNKAIGVIIKDAYSWWLEEEIQYEDDGVKTITFSSPRSKILEAQMKQCPLSYEELVLHLHDTRPDVKAVAKKDFFERFLEIECDRIIFLDDISAGRLPSDLLSKAIEIISPLSGSEFEVWKGLVLHENAKIRFASMSLMKNGYLDEVDIRYYASSMKDDVEQQIRHRANRILSILADA